MMALLPRNFKWRISDFKFASAKLVCGLQVHPFG